MIKTVFFIAFLSLFRPVLANAEISLNLSDGSELTLNVFEAQGESLLVALPSEHGITEGLNSLAEALSARGIEVWIADPFTTWFLPEAESSLARIPVPAYAELISAAEKTGKDIYLFSNDKGAGIALEAARAWQSVSSGPLSGVILVSPDLYRKTPVAGEDGALLPIATATNLPAYIFLPTKSTLALRIRQNVEALQKGGSDVYIQSLPDLRNRFYFRPDATELEQQAAADFADLVKQAMKLTRSFKRPRSAAELTTVENESSPKTTGSLREYSGKFQPQDFSLVDLNGQVHSLERHRGKVVLVNFWASWCPPCVHEMPSMSRLNDRLRDRPFVILAINLGEKTGDIHTFLQRHPVNFPVLLDPEQRLPRQWKVFAFPTSYLIDQQGRIRYSVAGGIDWNSAEVESAIDGLFDQ